VAFNLNHTYEKTCFALDHSFNRRRAYCFLRAKAAANDCNFDHGSDGQGVPIAFTGEKEEGCGEEEGAGGRSFAF
jgi:hypothetical protein